MLSLQDCSVFEMEEKILEVVSEPPRLSRERVSGFSRSAFRSKMIPPERINQTRVCRFLAVEEAHRQSSYQLMFPCFNDCPSPLFSPTFVLSARAPFTSLPFILIRGHCVRFCLISLWTDRLSVVVTHAQTVHGREKKKSNLTSFLVSLVCLCSPRF